MMNICVIGTGYVGLTTGTVLAHFGHTVYCVDKDKNKIDTLNCGIIPIFEPNLQELVNENKTRNNLYFLTDLQKAQENCEVILIAVGTPPNPDGSSNLSYLEDVLDELTKVMTTHKTIIVKSTVPLGTNEWIIQYLLEKGIDQKLFDIVSNPEFLREGSAVYDMLHPDKVVVGLKNPQPIRIMQKLYEKTNAPFIITSLTGAEMIKYASNAFLATKISFVNEIAKICDVYNVDIKEVTIGLGTDPRIGTHFLNPGLGFGGSCLPKDLLALQHASLKKNVVPEILNAVQKVNDTQVDYYFDKLIREFSTLKNKQISVWGLAFKPGTDDTRYSKSIRLIEKLVAAGAKVHVYDPIIDLKNQLPIERHNDMFSSIVDADCLIIATEWDEFKNIDWHKVQSSMKGNLVVDGRNIIDPRVLTKCKLKYLGVGRS